MGTFMTTNIFRCFLRDVTSAIIDNFLWLDISFEGEFINIIGFKHVLVFTAWDSGNLLGWFLMGINVF